MQLNNYKKIISFSANGYYSYIEASGFPAGSNALYQSIYNYPADNIDRCFRFWYHMLGNNIGSLVISRGISLTSKTEIFRQPCKQLPVYYMYFMVFVTKKIKK